MKRLLRWLDFLFPLRSDEAVLRDVSTDDFLAHLAPMLVPETRPGTITLFSFSNPRVRAAIHEAKYHGSAHAFDLLATALAEYLRDADDIPTARSNLAMLVPIPLGRERRKERGYNQAEEIANRVSKELGIAVDTTLLERTRETASQVSLPRRAREENMRGAFGTAHSADPSHTYIVVDDVITTGATLQAAVDALRAGGAEHIVPLALAH
jgi:ComF family protein